MTGIYKITNLVNNKIYIGQSKDIKKRWNNHKSACNNPNASEHDYHLYRAMRKYGLENFSFEVVEECNVQELNEKEKYWINYYDSYKNGYNSTWGGDSAPHSIKIDQEILNEIDNQLKTSDKNIQGIADMFSVSYEMIQGINTGRYWKRDINYPIRKQNINKNYCIDCGKEIDPGSVRCWECYKKSRLGCEIPNKDILLSQISKYTQKDVGKIYGVSGNTIKKWCKQYNIPHKRVDAEKYMKDNNIQ